MFHRHTYKLIERVYAPPTEVNVKCQFMSQDVIQKLIHGYTTLIFQCCDVSCADLKTVSAIGKTVPLTEPR